MPLPVNNLTNMTFLRCTSGGSDKFYAIIDLPNGQYMTGYGKSGSRGSWSPVTRNEALKKGREKMSPRKGYEHDVPQPNEQDSIALAIHDALKGSEVDYTASVSRDGVLFEFTDKSLGTRLPTSSAPKALETHPEWAGDW